MTKTESKYKEMAHGRWRELTLAEQLGNIGSEISRAINWKNRDQKLFNNAIDRALELFDLTLDDPRWRGRLLEIARAREIFCDVVFGKGEYQTTLKDLDRYFLNFAYLARLKT